MSIRQRREGLMFFGEMRDSLDAAYKKFFNLRQFVTGLILLFPHAILHEAGVTFLGFGLSSEQPAIGVILSESMSYLITGKWWLALFPGAALVLVTLGFQAIGQSLGRLMDPGSAHE